MIFSTEDHSLTRPLQHLERLLLASLTAILVARPLIASDDPGRLRLTSGAGATSFHLFLFGSLVLWAIGRAATRARKPLEWIPVVSLIGIAICTLISASGTDRYQRPGLFWAWEWFAVAAILVVTRQTTTSIHTARSITAVILAMAISLGAFGLYQPIAQQQGWPTGQVAPTPASLSTPQIGEDEFSLGLSPQPGKVGTFRSTLDAPASFLGYLLVTFPLGLVVLRSAFRRSNLGVWTVLLVGVLSVACGFAAFATFRGSDYPGLGTSQAITLIGKNPLKGIGPEQLSRAVFPDRLTSTGNSWLMLIVTTGLISGFLLLGAIVWTLVKVFRPIPSSEASPDFPRSLQPPWEIYIGASMGSVIGLILASGDLPADAPANAILDLGGMQVLRMLIWFAAFAILDAIPGNPRNCSRALAIGILLLSLLALLTDCLHSPAVLQLFGCSMGLMLSWHALSKPSATQESRTGKAIAFAPLCIVTPFLLVTVLLIILPAQRTASAIREASQRIEGFAEIRSGIGLKTGAERHLAIRRADDYLASYILEPLRRAAQTDTQNAALLTEMARWWRLHWRYLWEMNQLKAATEEGKRMLRFSEEASRLDPLNPAGKLASFESLLMIIRETRADRKERIPTLEKLIGEIAVREPWREVPLRFRMVNVLIDQQASDLLAAQALKLLELDAVVNAPHGRIPVELRHDFLNRLRQNLTAPSPELKKYLLD